MTECALCGLDSPDVRPSVAQWAEASPGSSTWEAIPRCPERSGCADRIIAAGGTWPLVEAHTPAPTGKVTPRAKAELDADLRAYRERTAQLVADGLMDPRPPKLDPATGEYRFRDPLPLPQIPLPEPDPVPPKPPPPAPPPAPAEDPSTWW